MSVVKIQGNPSGTGEFTIAAPNSNTNRTLTLPDQTGTVLTNAGPFTANASASAGAVTIDASNNVGIGTSSPRAKLSVTNGTENTSGDAPQEVIFTGANQTITSGLGILTVQSNTAIAADVGATIALGGRVRNTGTTTDASNFAVLKGAKENATSDNSAGYFAISTKSNASAPAERMRIDSSGNLLVGTTSLTGGRINAVNGSGLWVQKLQDAASNGSMIQFITPGGAQAGSITISGSTTTYGSGSDYRLKENVQPMVDALVKVAALRPVTFDWKENGSAGQGFIAHELQEHFPEAVQGEKDAVNEDGSIKPQGIDTSFLVATLTAALQELKAQVDAQAAEIAALKGAAS